MVLRFLPSAAQWPARACGWGVGVVLFCSVLLSAAALAWHEWGRVHERDRQSLEVLAGASQAHASELLESSNTVLNQLASSVLNDPRVLGPGLGLLQAQQAHYLQSLPFLRGLALVDGHGRIVLSSQPSEQGQRIDLTRLLSAPITDDRMHIGPWVGAAGLASSMATAAAAPAADASATSAISETPSVVGFIPLVRRIALSASDAVFWVAQLNPQALMAHQKQLLDTAAVGASVVLTLSDSEGHVLTPNTAAALPPTWHALIQQQPVRGSYGPLTPWQSGAVGAWYRGGGGHQPLIAWAQQPHTVLQAHWIAALRTPLIFIVLALVVVAAMTWSAWLSARGRDRAQRERDDAMQKMAQREQELSLLFKSIQALIFRTDTNGVIRLVNAQWQSLTAQNAEQARGRHLRDVVLDDCKHDVDVLFAPQQAASPNVRTAQVRLLAPQGQTRVLDISVVPLQDKDGQLRGFAGSAVDVSALWTAQQRVQEQLDFSSQLLQAVPLPIGLTDMQGRYLSVNPAWEKFMGLTHKQILGQRYRDFLPAQDAQVYEAHTSELLAGRGPVRYQGRLRGRDGQWRTIQITKVLLQRPHTRASGILTVKMDITDLSSAHHLAEQAAKTKSEFVANISHELRTPLQSILGFSELGMARGRQHEKLAHMFADIHAAGQRMLTLVNDLLDLAKIESTVGAFHFERHDVRDLIEDVGTELAPQVRSKNLTLALELGRAPLMAKLDPTRFSQVVRNVLANAIKFSPEGTSVRIQARQPDDTSIEITVQDQGPGIPASELETIFQAFVQSSQTRDGAGGTGLGLAICQKIVSAHGGRIYASNAAAGGAVFHITLPSANYTETMPAALQ